MCTCHKLLKQKDSLWTYLEIQDIGPTNNVAKIALRQAVFHSKNSYGLLSD